MKPFLLFIGDDGALLIPPQGIKHAQPFYAELRNTFQLSILLNALKSQPNCPYLIIADVLAQEYQRAAIPKLGWFDRRKLLARRLEQAFPESQLSSVWLQKKDHALFATLHEQGALSAWFEHLERLPNRQIGISLLPLEGARMMPHLHAATAKGWALMMSWNRTSGFRQIVTRDGDFVFTRVTPSLPLDADANAIVNVIARDLKASLGYLARLGLTDSKQLNMLALLPEHAHRALAQLNLPVQSLMITTPHQAAKHLHLSFAPATNDPTSDMLYAAWVTRYPPQTILMKPEARQAQQTRLIKRYGIVVALLAWVGTVTFIDVAAKNLFDLWQSNHTQAIRIAEATQNYNNERATLEPITQPLGRLRLALERQRLFTAITPTPWAVLQKISQALGDEARLEKLDWHDDESISLHLRSTKTDTPIDSATIVQALQHELPDYSVQTESDKAKASPDGMMTNKEIPPTKNAPSVELLLQKVNP